MSNSTNVRRYKNDPETNRRTAPENRLYRPQINFTKAFLTFTLVNTLTLLACSLVSFLLFKNNFLSAIFVDFFTVFFTLLPFFVLCEFFISLRQLLIWFIRIYQRYARSETRLRCRFEPSCSDYAILALIKHGVLFGTKKTIERILRCKPPGGIDYP